MGAETATVKPVGLPVRRRLWLIHATMGVIVAGSFFDIATGREHWPFSPYPMYAQVRYDQTLKRLCLYGVTSGIPGEIPLTAYRYVQPFQPGKLERALARMDRRREPRRRRLLTAALHDCLQRYEALRLGRRHDGPALQSIRLYRLQWKPDPWARNIDRPDRRELILEVRRG
jgi:hypothetical protein